MDDHIKAPHFLGGLASDKLCDSIKNAVSWRSVGKVNFNPEI
jgi:hypothetical protein